MYRYFCGLVICLTLTGCNETYSKQYLLTHPSLLEQAVKQCEKQMNRSAFNCRQVMEAKKVFIDYLRTQELEPIRYGRYILHAQMELVSMQERLNELEQQLAQAKQDPDQIQQKLTSIKQAYHEKQDELAMMLAVIGVDSP